MGENVQMRIFKARVENPMANVFAMEIYFKAPNIVEAGKYLVDSLGSIGVFSENVVRLVEVDKP
jgi:hypothetical protein